MNWLSKMLGPKPGNTYPEPKPENPKPGETYTGLLTYTTDPVIGRPGYYALDDDSKLLDPPVMLTWVDEDPTNEENINGHYVVVDPEQPYYSHHPVHTGPPNMVGFETHAQTTSNVSAS